MPPKIGKNDVLEQDYLKKFEYLTSKFGLFIKHERDRATLDVGLHLTEPSLKIKGQKTVSQVKVWFQLKGLHTTSLTRKKFEKEEYITIKGISIEQVKFWYASPEAVYFTVYVESVNSFFCEDVRDIVDREWGEAILNPSTLGSQKTVSLRLKKDSELNEERLKNMISHRSMRIDGSSFRGRPLGHRIDPLRSTLDVMESDVFQALMMRLLKEHNYETEGEINTNNLFSPSSGDIAKLLYGTMNFTYEWVYQITTQFAPDGKFRIEGEPHFAQGKCAILIHSKIVEEPNLEELKQIIDEISKKDIKHFLVFVNLNLIENNEYIGNFTTAYNETNIKLKHSRPQGLEDISFTVLTSTLVYLDFRDKLSFKDPNYLWD